MTDEELVRLVGLLGYVKSASADLWIKPGEDAPFLTLSGLLTWEGAGAVVGAMRALGYTRWSCDFYAQSSPGYTSAFWKSGQDNYKESAAATAPEAIARAALAALGGAG